MKPNVANGAIAPADARRAMAQCTLPEVVGVLGYAEGFGLVCAGLGHTSDPVALVRRVVDGVLVGRWPWTPSAGTFGEHVRHTLRDHVVAELERRSRSASDGRLSVLQLGRMENLGPVAHITGCVLATLRRADGSIAALASGVRDDVHRVLVTYAGDGGGADDAAM